MSEAAEPPEQEEKPLWDEFEDRVDEWEDSDNEILRAIAGAVRDHKEASQ